jgi:hypothetical protein
MQFLAPTNIFEGVVQLNSAPTADNHAVTKAFLQANAVVGIAPDSANYAELITVNGQKQLKLKPLTITDVSVDTVATSLSQWVDANYTVGDEKQEGDIIILTAVQGRAQTWIHTGGTAGDLTDFAPIEGADVDAAEVRTFLSASAGVAYNSATGEFTAVASEIRGFFGAGAGLAYDDANGVFSLNVDSDGISEGASNLYFTDLRARGAISVSGAGISYDSATGVIDLSLSTDDVAEGSNKYFSDAAARAAISADIAAGNLAQYNSGSGEILVAAADVVDLFSVGSGLAFDKGTGQITLTAKTDDIPEGLVNFYYKDSLVDQHLSGINGIAYNQGQISFVGNTDLVQEGPTNKYFTDSRARSAVKADPSANNLLQYNSGTGEMLVSITKFRKEFVPQNLTANTWATLAHNLGKKQVHVSAYDAGGNLIQLDVQLVDNNQLKIKSVINVTNAEVVVSL